MRVNSRAHFLVERKRVLAVAVSHTFDATHQPLTAHVADDRQFGKRRKTLLKMRRDGANMLQNTLALDDLDVLQGNGGTDRMAGIGVTVEKTKSFAPAPEMSSTSRSEMMQAPKGT